MKSTEFITEAPLPDDWDTKAFSSFNPIKKQVAYALERSKKIGSGSSRIVTSIMYQGRPTALKIAKNKKGLAQNEAELAIVNDGYAKGMAIIIPLIDYDKESVIPRWIQFEMAEKANEKQLCAIMKCARLTDVLLIAGIISGKNRDGGDRIASSVNVQRAAAGYSSQEDEDTFYEYVNELAELANSFDIELVDFQTASNWGIYKGRAVIIDVGFTSGVASSHYS